MKCKKCGYEISAGEFVVSDSPTTMWTCSECGGGNLFEKENHDKRWVTFEIIGKGEICTMNILEQVMDHFDKRRALRDDPIDQETRTRIARWFNDKYGKGE